MSEHSELLVSPPVGWRVQYLNMGDAANIFVADVTLCGQHGQVRINVQGVGGGSIRSIRDYVRRADDSHFQKFPDVLRKVGCWRYLPGQEYKPTREEIARESKYVEVHRQAEERVAQKVPKRGPGRPRNQVEAVATV
jgi:hypothetical protein